MGFWNVAGVNDKDEEFWEYIMNFDFIGMVETWAEEKSQRKIEKKVPREFRWKVFYAVRKGRAKGGIITGIRNNIDEVTTEDKVQNVQERRSRETGWRNLEDLHSI